MNEIEDFFVEAKINFYYILIKYIFKHPFFIYNISLLYNTRNTIIKIIKTKKEEFLSLYNIENFELLKRINYNIKFILDSNYYYKIFIDIIFDYILEEALKNNKEKWKEYIKDLNISEKFIDKMTLINYIYESKIKKKDKEKIEFKEIQKAFEQEEKMIKDKKIKKMRKDDKIILSKYFIDKNNRDSLLRIFGQDSYDFFLNESIKLNEVAKKEKNEKKNKLKQLLDYYNIFFFESKKEDISSIINAINDQGDLDFKKYEPDFEKAKMFNDRMPLIDYLYKIKDENKTESEMQQIIEKYNSLEKFISERDSKKDINIENETKSQLLNYFNNKNNEEFLINIFGKENYEFALKYFNENMDDNKNFEKNKKIDIDKLDKNNTKENYKGIKNQNNLEKDSLNLLSKSTKMYSKNIPMEKTNNSERAKSIEEKLANRLLKKSEIILNIKKEEKLSFNFESITYGDNHTFISYDKLQQIKLYLIKNKIESLIAKSYAKYMEFLDEFKNRICKEFIKDYKLKIGLEFQIIDKTNNDSIFNINCNYKFYSPDLNVASNQIFKEENILLNKTNSKTQGFEYLLNEINEEYFQKIKFLDSFPKETKKISDKNNNKSENKNNINNENKNEKNKESNIENITKFSIYNTNISSNDNSTYNYKEADKNHIVELTKIMGEGHKTTAEFIIELSNGYYISGGTDNILKNGFILVLKEKKYLIKKIKMIMILILN